MSKSTARMYFVHTLILKTNELKRRSFTLASHAKEHFINEMLYHGDQAAISTNLPKESLDRAIAKAKEQRTALFSTQLDPSEEDEP